MSTVTALRPRKTAPASPQPSAALALNALWLRLDQARAVAQCITDKCEDAWSQDGADTAAINQVLALSGAVAQLLSQAQADTAQLEGLLP